MYQSTHQKWYTPDWCELNYSLRHEEIRTYSTNIKKKPAWSCLKKSIFSLEFDESIPYNVMQTFVLFQKETKKQI